MQGSFFFTGSRQTPKPLKWLILFTVITSLLTPLLTYFLEYYTQAPTPTTWLVLSLFGLKHGWLWQFVTYFFLHTADISISLTFLFILFFQMFLLWFVGSEIYDRFGGKKFFFFYFSAGIVAGMSAALALFVFSSSSVLFGSTPAISALLLIWAMLYPNLELFFFFFMRLKVKWLVALYLLFILVFNLSHEAFIPFVANFSGMIWGFLLGRFVCKLPNPFPLNLELRRRRSKNHNQKNKIIDISVFQESEDAFMDRMLDKIAQQGESALTRRERERMQKISKKKNRID